MDLLKVTESQLDTTKEEVAHGQDLLLRGLPPLARTDVLSAILGVSHKLLFVMAHNPKKYYRTFQIPKRSGGDRLISTPRVFLKVVQRWILLNILYRRGLPDYVTGFVPGRGILANAQFHVGRRYLLRIDLQDFFPSVGYDKVKRVFNSFEFREKVSNLLTNLCLLDGSLPQGAPTSPCLANLVFGACDEQIYALSRTSGITYSRYADDLTFSSDEPINKNLALSVEKIVAAEHFRINWEKYRTARPGQRLFTTGMVVNEKVQPVRKLRRRLRVRFHQAQHNPEAFKKEAHQLMGWAAFVNMYNSDLGNKYLGIANRVLESTRPSQ